MSRLQGKVAIVTGGAAGIGEAIVEAFAREGADVTIADIQVSSGRALATRVTGASFVEADVSNSKSVQALMEKTRSRFGKLDLLVNNAAVLVSGVTIADHSEEDFDRTIAVNLKGPWLCTKYAVDLLKAASGASVINISSVASVLGNPDQTAYGASKGGLAQLTRHCAAELAGFGIRVNTISPGGVVTPMLFQFKPGMSREQLMERNAQGNPLGRAGMPEDVAATAVWLASDDAAHVTAQNIVLDGGLTLIRRNM